MIEPKGNASLALIALAGGMAIGCGGGPQMADVSGVVTMNGEPVAGVIVRFQPQPPPGEIYAATKGAIAEVDEEGRFHLSTNAAFDGAVVGVHTVNVANANRDAPPPGVLPEGFSVEVKPGGNEVTLELSPLGR